MRSICRKPQPKRKFWKSRGKPRLFRFSWEQRKLGEMGQTYTGLSGKTKDDFGHGQARFVTYMNVFSNPISNPEMTEPIEIDPKQNEVEVGDVFFTTSSETPEEVGMSSILLEKRGKTYLNSFCFGFRPSEKIDSYYLAYMLRSESARAKITLLAQGISRYNISKNKVMEIAVSLPSLDEQKMIGQYFSQLDNLITLHQRTASSIAIKNVGETHPWEQRKLGDFTKRVQGNDGRMDLPTLTISAGSGWLDQRDRFSANIAGKEQQNYTLLHKGELSYNHGNSKLAKYGAVFSLRTYEEALVPRVYHSFKVTDAADADYIEYIFATKLPDKELGKLISSGARMDGLLNINYDEFMGIKITIPSVEEQKQLSTYFRNLDNLITLHQRERKNRLFGGKNVKQYNFSRPVLQLLCAMDSRLQRRGSPQGDYG